MVCNASPSGLTPIRVGAASHQLLYRYERRSAHMVLAKGESDPIVPVPLSFLLDRLDVALFLKHLCVLCHILGRLKRVKVPYVGVSIKNGHERCGDFAQAGERKGRKEGQGLDVWERGHPVFRVSDQSGVRIVSSRVVMDRSKTHRTTASQAVSVKLKMRSSGRS